MVNHIRLARAAADEGATQDRTPSSRAALARTIVFFFIGDVAISLLG
jgi:hypothetical protein